MRLEIKIDRQNPEAVYRQIAEGVRGEVLTGDLPAGTKLPTIRELAAQLGVANQTAVAAYRLLIEWGIAEATVGSGTFVSNHLPALETKGRLEQLVGTGPIADFETMSATGGLRSLATAVPDPNLFHADEFLAECNAFRAGSPWSFYYTPSSGMPELRAAICRWMVGGGVKVTEPEVIVTLGALNALALVVDELCVAGDEVLLESPGFLGADLFFAARKIKVLRVRTGVEGLDLKDLEMKAKGARLLICSPSFGTTHGRLMPLESRIELLALASRLNLTIVEDAHYARVAFSQVPPPLISLASREDVIHIDSLSACLSPGVRTGWIVCAPSLRRRLEDRVRWMGAGGVSVIQLAMAEFIKSGKLARHLQRVVPRYRERREAMVSALNLHFPRQARFLRPEGGLSVWVELPSEVETSELYVSALRHGVPFSPSSAFDHGGQANGMRLSYGTKEPETIAASVASLGELVSQRMK